MIEDIAIDTNILVYCHSNDEPDKKEIATRLLDLQPTVSTQVLSEYLNVVKRRLKLPKEEILQVCRQNIEFCRLFAVNNNTLKFAGELISLYDFQMFDSIVVAAAFEANCKILYSEDLHHGLLIKKQLRIINPFT